MATNDFENIRNSLRRLMSLNSKIPLEIEFDDIINFSNDITEESESKVDLNDLPFLLNSFILPHFEKRMSSVLNKSFGYEVISKEKFNLNFKKSNSEIDDFKNHFIKELKNEISEKVEFNVDYLFNDISYFAIDNLKKYENAHSSKKKVNELFSSKFNKFKNTDAAKKIYTSTATKKVLTGKLSKKMLVTTVMFLCKFNIASYLLSTAITSIFYSFSEERKILIQNILNKEAIKKNIDSILKEIKTNLYKNIDKGIEIYFSKIIESYENIDESDTDVKKLFILELEYIRDRELKTLINFKNIYTNRKKSYLEPTLDNIFNIEPETNFISDEHLYYTLLENYILINTGDDFSEQKNRELKSPSIEKWLSMIEKLVKYKNNGIIPFRSDYNIQVDQNTAKRRKIFFVKSNQSTTFLYSLIGEFIKFGLSYEAIFKKKTILFNYAKKLKDKNNHLDDNDLNKLIIKEFLNQKITFKKDEFDSFEMLYYYSKEGYGMDFTPWSIMSSTFNDIDWKFQSAKNFEFTVIIKSLNNYKYFEEVGTKFKSTASPFEWSQLQKNDVIVSNWALNGMSTNTKSLRFGIYSVYLEKLSINLTFHNQILTASETMNWN